MCCIYSYICSPCIEVYTSVCLWMDIINYWPLYMPLFCNIGQIPEVPHQEVPEEEQPPWLAEGRGVWQGDVRAALLPDQPGRRGVRGWRVGPSLWAMLSLCGAPYPAWSQYLLTRAWCCGGWGAGWGRLSLWPRWTFFQKMRNKCQKHHCLCCFILSNVIFLKA